jgi:hypothetical protein
MKTHPLATLTAITRTNLLGTTADARAGDVGTARSAGSPAAERAAGTRDLHAEDEV